MEQAFACLDGAEKHALAGILGKLARRAEAAPAARKQEGLEP
jgi:hypothetical protein